MFKSTQFSFILHGSEKMKREYTDDLSRHRNVSYSTAASTHKTARTTWAKMRATSQGTRPESKFSVEKKNRETDPMSRVEGAAITSIERLGEKNSLEMMNFE